jgi:UDP-N-acetyl-2-amino-2-deoxyglucuronate dehydrogenase
VRKMVWALSVMLVLSVIVAGCGGPTAKYGVNIFGSYEEVLADRDTAMVIICLPPGLHVDFGLQAAAGKHLVLEKPMDISLDKARQLIREYRSRQLTLSVIFQNRFTPAAQRV